MTIFFDKFVKINAQEFTSKWMAPSNIAFVKYWGKRENQIPANSSLSMTLSECRTITQTHFIPSDHLKVELFLDGKENPAFSKKIFNYVEKLIPLLPVLSKVHLKIETSNTFPHGTGIASSASGMAAIALTMTDFLYHCSGLSKTLDFYKEASFLARLGSGSACRSLFGGFTTWGEYSSNEFATPLEVHESFKNLNDSILVVSSEEKKVSSTSGHGLMNDHFYAERRFTQANFNLNRCVSALQSGDMDLLGSILESEALSLHAMMLTSPSPYILLLPNTLKAIEILLQFRRDTKIPVYFTLDAGPNLHLIYPESDKKNVLTFINSELSHLSEMIIHDRLGDGPVLC